MIVIHNYDVVVVGQRYYVKNKDKVILCEYCNRPLKVRGSKSRYVISSDGNKVRFQLRQLVCLSCRKVHIECPDIIAPNKHYALSVIKEAVCNVYSVCCAENTTIWRWKKEMQQHNSTYGNI